MMKSSSILKQVILPSLSLSLLFILFAGCGNDSAVGGSGGNCVGITCGNVGGGGGGGGSQTAPTLSIAPGDRENVLTFTQPSGTAATTFNLYWSTSPQVTTATGTQIAGVTSPFPHTGLANGAPIFYVATAVVAGGESTPSAVAGGMPGKWTALNASNPPPVRDSHTAVYNGTSDRMIVFGGKDLSTTLQDFWVLADPKGNSPAWTAPNDIGPPSKRNGHTAVYNDAIDQMIVFGGASDVLGSSLLNDLYSLSNADGPGSSTWQVLASGGSGPGPRWGHAAVYDQKNNKMVVFGGAQTGITLFNDVWVLDNATQVNASWRAVPVAGGPSKRSSMTVAYDSANRRMILFGGSGGSQIVFGDLWTLTFNEDTFLTANWQELTPSGGTPISARCCGVSLWDGSNLLLFGGGTFNSSSDDKIYALALQSPTFTSAVGPAGPTARTFPTAVPAGRFLVFGGTSAFQPLNDLWRLD